jgi:hypothetical protein
MPLPSDTIPNTSEPAAGKGLTLDLLGHVPGQILALSILAADPTAPFEGQVWIRSDLNELRWREGATTYKVAGTAV